MFMSAAARSTCRSHHCLVYSDTEKSYTVFCTYISPWSQHLRRECRVIHRIGKSLALYGHAVVVGITSAALVLRRALQEIARVNLHARLRGENLDLPSRIPIVHAAHAAQNVLLPPVYCPAMVVTSDCRHEIEIAVDVAPNLLCGLEIHRQCRATGAISPVGICTLSFTRKREQSSCNVCPSTEPLSCPARFRYRCDVRFTTVAPSLVAA